MTGRGILVYGSLLHEPTLAGTLSSETVDAAVPVRVEGYRRSFNKPSAHREGEDGEKAILVPDVPDEEFEHYRQREHRYDLVDVPPERISAYEGFESGVPGRLDERLIATSDGTLDHPEPIPYYAAKCVEGATGWGEKFLSEFLITTDHV